MLLALWVRPCLAVTITVKNLDDPGEGFNDPTFALPVGGNTGKTLGQQRLKVFQYAADAWGMRLVGTVPVIVGASFDSMGGTATMATLGGAGARTLHDNFSGAERADTWYVAAVANQQRGLDLNGSEVEISGAFNSDVDDPEVLGDIGFYYGLDGNHGANIDFLTVVLHEIAHGLGFLDLMDPDTGAKFNGKNDAYMVWLQDPKISPASLSEMNDMKRQMAMLDTGSLYWFGPAVRRAGPDVCAQSLRIRFVHLAFRRHADPQRIDGAVRDDGVARSAPDDSTPRRCRLDSSARSGMRGRQR